MKRLRRTILVFSVVLLALVVLSSRWHTTDQTSGAGADDSMRTSLTLAPLPFAQAQEVLGQEARSGAEGSAVPLARRSEEEERTIQIYKRAEQAVVFITTITLSVDPFELFPEVQQREGSGSGIIVDAQRGIVITNLHVIQDAHKIEISLVTGQTLRAKLLGMDEAFDVAVLQLIDPPPGLVSLPFADSYRIEVGQRVLAIGNPFGLDRTLTAGIISSVNRTVKGAKGRLMRGLVQTDAAINPGNSGGPLLDMEGRLIGMNSAILSQSGDSAGIGFAVPINQIRRVLPELIATGKVLRPQVGWIIVDTTQGPMVRRVVAGSAAEEAGVQPIERSIQNGPFQGFVRDFPRADLVYRINGTVVRSREEIEELVSQSSRDRPLVVTLRRGGVTGPEREVKITPQLG
jgi:S1-C subfamily serine protease